MNAWLRLLGDEPIERPSGRDGMRQTRCEKLPKLQPRDLYTTGEVMKQPAGGTANPTLARRRQPVSETADLCAVAQTLDPAGATQE